jgi:hypothetical protein
LTSCLLGIAIEKPKSALPSFNLYARRHLIECCFSQLEQLRRVVTRFEKTREK